MLVTTGIHVAFGLEKRFVAPCSIVQAFKRGKFRTLLHLEPEGLVTTSPGVTSSDIWCEEYRVNVSGLCLLLHGEFLLSSANFEESYLLWHSHSVAKVSLNYGFVTMFRGWQIIKSQQGLRSKFFFAASLVSFLFSCFVWCVCCHDGWTSLGALGRATRSSLNDRIDSS